ncbi:SGNH/GDSL hydrolase family protein [Pontiella sp. NLcol2]|uniref:SGNH/GDSL hydrolase family protein n=2 Tax=Pontiella agarivorans TaxID=3038953 RepID=A0ABU5MTB5_9BACT|nr:SGNH/GDSL hydrolase family protein [Pontiella agarivorans]
MALTSAAVLPAWAVASKKVLFLGDEVMFAYKPDLLKLIGDKAHCTFVPFPKVGKPDWETFCNTYVYGKGYDVIHFSYGRELMFHENGEPRGKNEETWGIYTGLIKALRKSGAFLVGCTTTPVRGAMPGYEGAVDWNYNARFKQMLGPSGVKINDLGDYTRTRLSEMVQNDSNLPTPLGAQLMAEQVANAVFEAFNEGQDPDRPRILMVGDSIVGGYYGATRNRFAGEAIVYSGGTTYNDAQPDWKKIVDEYIEKGGARGWDVIQFNWGLHAMKHVDADHKTINADQPGARIQFSPEEYIQQLELFVTELKRTGAQLVFATTTPIPKDCSGSIVFLDQSAYNEPAKKLMERAGIAVNDLYAFVLPRMKELMIPRNVHFTAYGSEQLAEQNYSVLCSLISK